jgi:DNA-binding phage protein
MDKIDIDVLPTWDAADYLGTPSLQAEYLSIVLDDGDEAEITHALAAIARARAKAGLKANAETPSDPAIDKDGATAISKALSLVKALGLKLNVQPADAA